MSFFIYQPTKHLNVQPDKPIVTESPLRKPRCKALTDKSHKESLWNTAGASGSWGGGAVVHRVFIHCLLSSSNNL